MKILVTGGVRAGKTRHALALAEELAPRRHYLATAQALDDEMRQRIRRHQLERGAGWHTIEEPLDVASHLAQPGGVVLVDCLTLWLTNWMLRPQAPDYERLFGELAAAVEAAPNPVVLVTNEVGLGIVPDNALARDFRDRAGFLAQRVAAACDRVDLMVAGLPLRVKG